MAGSHMSETRQEIAFQARDLGFQLREPILYPFAPKQLRGSTSRAKRGVDRCFSELCVAGGALLENGAERTDHLMTTIVGDEFWGHCLELAAEKLVHQKGFDEVIGVMPQSDFTIPELGGSTI